MTITGGRIGIYNHNADLVIDHCVISGNSQNGLLNEGDTVLNASTVSENTGDRAGGIYNSHWLTITSSTIANNTATGLVRYAGGIYHWSDTGTLTIDNSTISGNTGDDVGGVFVADGDAIITNTTITNNTGTLAGGLYVAEPHGYRG